MAMKIHEAKNRNESGAKMAWEAEREPTAASSHSADPTFVISSLG